MHSKFAAKFVNCQ